MEWAEGVSAGMAAEQERQKRIAAKQKQADRLRAIEANRIEREAVFEKQLADDMAALKAEQQRKAEGERSVTKPDDISQSLWDHLQSQAGIRELGRER